MAEVMALPPNGAIKACPRCSGIAIFRSRTPPPANDAGASDSAPLLEEYAPAWRCDFCGYYEPVSP
jgi:hypothetical protein